MYRILAVDDEAAVLRDLRGLVDWESLDAEIAACAGGAEEALALLAREPVDILITDLRMAGMDGLALIARARETHPSLRCIVISAHDDFSYARDALRLGVENYLLKPINPSELAETMLATVKGLDATRAAVTAAAATAATAATAAPAPADALAFRSTILNRWVQGAIQDFELVERAVMLDLDLEHAEFAALIAASAEVSPPHERLEGAVRLAAGLRSLLAGPFNAEVFVDEKARAVAVLRGASLGGRRAELEALLGRGMGDGSLPACVITVGVPVASAFSVSASYRDAHLLQGVRYLRPATRCAFCADEPALAFRPGAAESVELLRFRRALEDLDEETAAALVRRRMASLAPAAAAGVFNGLLPYLLQVIDAALSRGGGGDPWMPARLPQRLAALSGMDGRAALESAAADAVAESVRIMKGARGAMHPLVRQVLDLVHRSYSEDLSIKTIAAQFKVNPSYLGQLLKSWTGDLFHEYLTKVRMHEARLLLMGTDLRIAEIAQRVGVPQQSYFNRLFRKVTGMTPVEYRRR
jgi:two-component system, response regulator YesN